MRSETQKIEDLIKKSFVEKKRFISEEHILKGDPKHIYSYIINSKMKKEDIPNWMISFISTSPALSILLTSKLDCKNKDLIDAIASSPITSYNYSIIVLNDRFPEGEESIMKSHSHRKRYLEFLKSIRTDE